MGSEPAKKAKSPWGRWSPKTWVHVPEAGARIVNAGGTEEGCAEYLGVSRSTFRGWLYENKHLGWLPIRLKPKFDEYIENTNSAGCAEEAVGTDGETAAAAAPSVPPRVVLRARDTIPGDETFANFELGSEGEQVSVAEGEALNLYYQIYCMPHETEGGMLVGIRRFRLHIELPKDGSAKWMRNPHLPSRPGVAIEAHGTERQPFYWFSAAEPPMRLNNLLDGENPLGAYVDGHVGDALEVRMVASLVNTFVCQRADDQGRAPRPAKSVNKERIKALLASHRYFGPRLHDAEELVLATQTLKIERKR